MHQHTATGPILELHEARAWEEFHRAVPEATGRELGVAVHRIAGATAGAVGGLDILAHNRVLGLGVTTPVTDADLDAITAWYRDAGARRFFVQLSPAVATRELLGRLAARGFYHYNNWVKLSRDASPPPPVKTDLHIEQVGPDLGPAFAKVFVESFGHDPALRPWIAALPGRPGWTHYMAFDDGSPVATAAMFVENGAAWLDFASTLPAYRGRGAQSALYARRIQDCAHLGCNLLVVETAEDTPEHGAPSYRNALRMGFVPAYLRPNYILEMDQSPLR